jgi:flagellar capping protein FliD
MHMSEENTLPETNRTLYKVDDNVIAMVRELVQLSLLTGTNIVDHLRSLVLEVHPEDNRYVTLCPEFVESYNRMVDGLNKQAEEQMLENEKQLAASEPTPPALLD